MFRKPSSQSISGTQITGSQVQQGQAEQVLIQLGQKFSNC